MAFNSNAYHANKWAKKAWADLAAAREAKANANPDRVAFHALMARNAMKMARSYRVLRGIQLELRKLHTGRAA